MWALPAFLLALALEVDWTSEKPCFHGIALALASFYAVPMPVTPPSAGADGPEGGAAGEEEPPRNRAAAWHVEHVLMPAFRRVLALAPPRKLNNGHFVVQLTSTENLYKVFERC